MSGYIAALGLTLLVEVPVYAILLDEVLGCARRDAVIAALLINLVSHPLAFVVVVPLDHHVLGWPADVAVAEALVWGGEASALWLWLRRQPGLVALVALIANGLSLSIGLLVFR